VHHPGEIAQINYEASARGVSLRAEKLESFSEADRQAAFGWDMDVLINNAAIGQAGPIAEIPLELIRRVFEVNVFATLALTQGIARQMARRGRGGWSSSRLSPA
jgi:short-subunit dehydrogenase